MINLLDFQKQAVTDMQQLIKNRVPVELQLSYAKDIIMTRHFLLKNATLALDMGLGKTFISLEFLKHEIINNPTHPNLILVPHSLSIQWNNETNKFFDDKFLKQYVYRINSISNCGGSYNFRQRLPVIFNTYKIVIINMNTIRLYYEIKEIIKNTQFNIIIVDEEWPDLEMNTLNYEFSWFLSATCSKLKYSINLKDELTLIENYLTKNSSIIQSTNYQNSFPKYTVNSHEITFKTFTDKLLGHEFETLHLISASSQVDFLKEKVTFIQQEIKRLNELKDNIRLHDQYKLQSYINTLNELQKRDINNMCIICYENYSDTIKKVPLDCCKQDICNACLANLCTLNIKSCPHCRIGTIKQTIQQLGNLLTPISTPGSFEIEFLKLINTLQGKTIIVYYRKSEDTFSDMIVNKLRLHIQTTDNTQQQQPLQLYGNSHQIASIVRKFEANGRFLIVNAYFFNFGFNFQFVDNLVIVNHITETVALTQIEGRCLRLGRNKPLNKYIFRAHNHTSTHTLDTSFSSAEPYSPRLEFDGSTYFLDSELEHAYSD